MLLTWWGRHSCVPREPAVPEIRGGNARAEPILRTSCGRGCRFA